MALDAYKLAKEHDPRGEIGCFLGKLYYHGHGVNQNYDKSFEYFKEGFKKSFRDGYDDVEPELNYYIGLSFVNGYGTEKNLEKGKVKSIPQQELAEDDSFAIYDYKEVDKAPTPYFNNQNITIGSYLRSELKYPDQAKEFEISGTVKLSFIIETDGKASNIVIENSVGGGCDNEAVRLMQNLLWIPGVKDGKLVRVKTTQDITFQFGERNYHDGNQY